LRICSQILSSGKVLRAARHNATDPSIAAMVISARLSARALSIPELCSDSLMSRCHPHLPLTIHLYELDAFDLTGDAVIGDH